MPRRERGSQKQPHNRERISPQPIRHAIHGRSACDPPNPGTQPPNAEGHRRLCPDGACSRGLHGRAAARINVVAKQWSWDFNYVDADVHEDPGVQSFRTGEEGAAEDLPTLYLPVGETVEFQLDSRDVIHSFWVVDFLYKKDMFPGHTTAFQVTPQIEGTYAGKCAELCGEFHSDMLFNVKVVSKQEFEAHMEELRAKGNTGQLSNDLNRLQKSWNMKDDSDRRIENRREDAKK